MTDRITRSRAIVSNEQREEISSEETKSEEITVFQKSQIKEKEFAIKGQKAKKKIKKLSEERDQALRDLSTL